MVRTNSVKKSAGLFAGTLFQPNLPDVFRQIHNYLYANSNIPRAERLGAEMVRILFCKIFDEVYNRTDAQFHMEPGEDVYIAADRIRRLFANVKTAYPDVFQKGEDIVLDDKSIAHVIERLQNYVLTGTERDVISEAFQAFWGSGLRGEKGQFFTPRNVVKMCVEMLDPKPGERIIDPACGSGGFLVEILTHLGNPDLFSNIYGIDKETDLVKICKAYMAIVGDGHTNVFCADSLHSQSWSEEMGLAVADGSFDVVLTNPPFGAKIFIEDRDILRNYELGHEWAKKDPDVWQATNRVSKQVPQILFVERCLQLLKPGGRMAIVLPDGVFGNPTDRYVWQFVLDNARILAIVSLPPETFLPSTHTKTSVLFLEKTQMCAADYDIFMGIAEKVGHDKNGKMAFQMGRDGAYVRDDKGAMIMDDDLPAIASLYRAFAQKLDSREASHLGFVVKRSQIGHHVFVPGYYDPETKQQLEEMETTGNYRLVTIGELAKQGTISIRRGHEVGSRFYGMGDVPFVRTSDIVNWEIKVDPVKSIPEEVYVRYKGQQDVQEDDVLLVSDGTFLIGRTAMVTSLDKRLVIQSHIRRIRCLKPSVLHPYLLLYLLNTKIVQRQIREKTFVQATISTIGERLLEIVLPIPPEQPTKDAIISQVSQIIKKKVDARREMETLIGNQQGV